MKNGWRKQLYLADIFHHMTKLNKSPHGPAENVLTSSDKILGFKGKLNHWKNHVVKGNLEILLLLQGLESEGYQQISNTIETILKNCGTKLNNIFLLF
jgi:hypothetical protein